MKVGMNTAMELKEISLQRGIPFADMLYAYLVENLIDRIYRSSFAENIWLLEESGKSLHDCALCAGERLDFFYIKGNRTFSPEKLVAGQILSRELMEVMAEEIFAQEHKSGVKWSYQMEQLESCYRIRLTGEYKEMSVPINIRMVPLEDESARAVKLEMPMILKPEKTISYYSYAPENLISEHVIEIMRKLELIGDMKSYSVVNDILRTQSVSGRYILEELHRFAEKEPKVVKQKRMEQVAGYREYTYMRKRWEQYCKNHGKEVEPWTEVLDRIVTFLQPIWTSLCNNDIFFDDWMPELGRYLG